MYTFFPDNDINSCPAKLVYLNFQPLEVVSRYRDPQPQWLKITHICLVWDQTFTNFISNSSNLIG